MGFFVFCFKDFMFPGPTTFTSSTQHHYCTYFILLLVIIVRVPTLLWASMLSSLNHHHRLLAPGSACITAQIPWPPIQTRHYTHWQLLPTPLNQDSNVSLNRVLHRQKLVSASVLQDFTLNEICWNQTNKSLATEGHLSEWKVHTKPELHVKRHTKKRSVTT